MLSLDQLGLKSKSATSLVHQATIKATRYFEHQFNTRRWNIPPAMIDTRSSKV